VEVVIEFWYILSDRLVEVNERLLRCLVDLCRATRLLSTLAFEFRGLNVDKAPITLQYLSH
jgi:hypothetical protein